MPADEPIVPDRSPGPSPATFKWPCERRVAHGPHDRTLIGWCGGFGELREFLDDPAGGPNTRYPDPVYVLGEGGVTNQKRCPGVLAHPRTMIGGGFNA